MTQDEILALLRQLARALEGNAYGAYPVEPEKVKDAIEHIETVLAGRKKARRVVVDGVKSPLFPGEVVKFWTGDIAKIVSVEGPVLRLDREISAPDNCGIWGNG